MKINHEDPKQLKQALDFLCKDYDPKEVEIIRHLFAYYMEWANKVNLRNLGSESPVKRRLLEALDEAFYEAEQIITASDKDFIQIILHIIMYHIAISGVDISEIHASNYIARLVLKEMYPTIPNIKSRADSLEEYKLSTMISAIGSIKLFQIRTNNYDFKLEPEKVPIVDKPAIKFKKTKTIVDIVDDTYSDLEKIKTNPSYHIDPTVKVYTKVRAFIHSKEFIEAYQCLLDGEFTVIDMSELFNKSLTGILQNIETFERLHMLMPYKETRKKPKRKVDMQKKEEKNKENKESSENITVQITPPDEEEDQYDIIVKNTVVPLTKKIELLVDKKIMIVGGHINLIKKFKGIFPNYRYIDTDERNIPTLGNIEKVYFMFNHISHKTYNPILNKCREAKVPVGYLQTVNIEQLVNQIYNEIVVR